MKYLHYLIVLTIILSSCEKGEFKNIPVSSIKIVNAVSGGSAIRLAGNRTEVYGNSSWDFSIYSDTPNVYVWPVGDSANPYYNPLKSVDFNDRAMYTLFLGGDVTAVETIMIKENFPMHNDSTAGIRIINLSPNSPALKVTLSTSSGTSEFGDINYKQITDFKTYPATSANSEYTFEFRDAATDEIISSTTMYYGAALSDFIPVFRNVTLVFRDIVGGDPAAGITRVNHYK
jgi:hypothetical protein